MSAGLKGKTDGTHTFCENLEQSAEYKAMAAGVELGDLSILHPDNELRTYCDKYCCGCHPT